MAEPRRADGERGRQLDRLVGLVRERGDPHRDVDVGRREHADVVELAQQARRMARAADVEEVELDHAGTPRSSRSLSATTSRAGGRHENTPHGVPPTAGVSGPVIPRTNRYRTPARWRSGS